MRERPAEGRWPVSFEEHRRDQIRWIARHSTPAERLAWLEAAIELARRAGATPAMGDRGTR